MRLKIKAEVENYNGKNCIPINYQYNMAAVLYRIIENGNKEFSSWLHQTGFSDASKKFKLFTFSKLNPDKYEIKADRLYLKSPYISFFVSFCVDKQVEPFVKGLFSGSAFNIGDKLNRTDFKITGAEVLKDPDFSRKPVSFRALSPIVISFKELSKKHATYIDPKHPGYAAMLIKNLTEKYRALTGENEFTDKVIDNCGFRYFNEPKRKGIHIKQGTPEESKIIGYEYRFSISLPEPLLKIGYNAGFGEKNSMGFGYVEI